MKLFSLNKVTLFLLIIFFTGTHNKITNAQSNVENNQVKKPKHKTSYLRSTVQRKVSTTTTNYCGTSWTDANARCGKSCPAGMNNECPSGQSCYGGVGSCNNVSPVVSPTATTTTTNYCGTSWTDANARCGKSCPAGLNNECPSGQSCFGGVGSCNNVSPVASPTAPTGSTPTNTKTTNYCGTSWTDANARCGKSCPAGLNNECPSGQSCYGGVGSCNTTPPLPTLSPIAVISLSPSETTTLATSPPSDILISQSPSISPSNLPSIQNTNFCGFTWMEASECGSHVCTSGSSIECPIGQACYGGIDACRSKNTNFCGSQGFFWVEANKCERACPSGLNTECPFGELCYGGIFSCENSNPTTSPTLTPLYFDGIVDVYSYDKGELDIGWDYADHEAISEPTDITYHVFVALGSFDYDSSLSNYSIRELAIEFENESTFQYHIVPGNIYELELISLYAGQLHSLLVVAELNDMGLFSRNTAATEIFTSSTTPVVREGVNVIGTFVPSENIDIILDNVDSLDQPHSLLFMGALQPEHFALNAGDNIFGFTSEVSTFIRRIDEVLEMENNLLRLNVVSVPLEELFVEVDLEASVPTSRKKGFRETSSRRRLFFSAAWNWAKRQVNKAVKWVSKAFDSAINFISDLAQKTIQFLELLVSGKYNENFNLVTIDESFEEKLTSQVTLSGDMNFETKLAVQIKVKFDQLYTSVTLSADYSIGARLDFIASASEEKEKTIELWSGAKNRYFIAIVEVNWEPKVDLVAKVEASFKASAHFETSYYGDTSMSVTVDTKQSPVISSDFVKPSLKRRDHSFDLDGEATMKSSVALVFSVQFGIYDRLLEAEAGVSLGLGFEAAVGLELLRQTPIVHIDKFDIDIELALPFSASAVWGKFSLVDTNLLEKSWPLLALPSVEIGVAKDFMCELGGGMNGNNAASIDLVALKKNSDAFIPNGFSDGITWYLGDGFEGWDLINSESETVTLINTKVAPSTSSIPKGKLYATLQAEIPPLLKRLISYDLSTINNDTIECLDAGTCSGDDFFDTLSTNLSSNFNSNVFLSQPPDPTAPLEPSKVYQFEDFMSALKDLQNTGEQFQMWLGDGCGVEAQKQAFVNIAAFLGQAMKETIIYDACDENNWDLWRADIFKEPTSPEEYLPSLYPMSSGCGQLGQKYADYDCEDACPRDAQMELTATTNAGWNGAPPPLMCGPRSTYDDLGYWNPMKLCQGPNNSCVDQPFFYQGQLAGVHVPVSEDDRFPEFFYTNPLPDANGNTPNPRPSDALPNTNVEGCCWWGRGVIQTTGRCNFGKLNKNLGAGAGENALYPDINFCKNPQSICEGPSELKWIAGIFFWATEVEKYDEDGFNYKEGVKSFVEKGCADDPDQDGCDLLFEYASGIVNRGCHDPGENGCPGCIPGSTCDPAHNIPERVASSKLALCTLMKALGSERDCSSEGGIGGGSDGTCGGGKVGNGICADTNLCCSQFGFCGSSAEHCSGK